MRVTHRTVAIAMLLMSLCPRAYAPIFGGYPGVRSLIKQSDVIAAITILQRSSEVELGGSALYNVEFEKVLKGNLHEKKAVVRLRRLDIETPNTLASDFQSTPPPQRTPTATPLPGSLPVTYYFDLDDLIYPFHPSSRWIAFLAKTTGDKEAAFENVNCMGSTFPLSPLTDLDILKVASLPDTLILLFREYVDFKRDELRKWEHQLDAFIHESEN